MKEKILEVLNSEQFQQRLNVINSNYSNLKQELLIRNALLEIINFNYHHEDLKAFAEYPREKGKKVDLSIVNRKGQQTEIYSIELKYQFTNDFNAFKNYRGLQQDLDKLINNKCADLFILIVSEWDRVEKEKHDERWKIYPNLSNYLSKKSEWKANLEELCSLHAKIVDIIHIEVKEPYLTKYYFYVLEKSPAILPTEMLPGQLSVKMDIEANNL